MKKIKYTLTVEEDGNIIIENINNKTYWLETDFKRQPEYLIFKQEIYYRCIKKFNILSDAINYLNKIMKK